MKKRFMVLALLLSSALMLTACGNKKEEAAAPVGDDIFASIDPDDYVKVGDYSKLSAAVNLYDYTDEDVDYCVDNELKYYVESYDLYDYVIAKDKDTVSMNDIVEIDYKGTIDGVAFDGGEAQGAHLEIGSGSFIAGFEDGLVGTKVGDEVDLNLKFPDAYHNADLAGKDCVFSVSVNAIVDKKDPEITDQLIADMGTGATNMDEFKESVRQYLQDACDEQNASVKESAVWDSVYNTCEISDPPQAVIDHFKAQILEYYQSYADYYGMGIEELASTYFNMDMEAFEAQNLEEATKEAKTELACMAIAKKEKIDVTDEVIKTVAEEKYEENGYESADAFIEAMGDTSMKSFVRRTLVSKKLEEIVTLDEGETVPFVDRTEEE